MDFRFKKYAVFCLLGLWALLSAGCAGFSLPGLRRARQDTALERVLGEIYLERRDLAVPQEIKRRDPFLLSRVPLCLAEPLQAISVADGIEKAAGNAAGSLGAMAALCGDLLEVSVTGPDENREPSPPLSGAPLRDALNTLYAATARAQQLYREAMEGLSPEEILFVRQRLEQLLFNDQGDPGLSRWERQALTERAFRLAARIDLQKIVQAGYALADAVDAVLEDLAGGSWTGDTQRAAMPGGEVVVGGTGDDVHSGAMPLILIDLGGNDLYRFETHSPFHVIIDLGGDDRYRAGPSVFPGAGVMGVGVLVDLQGDDLYQGATYAFGSGFMGAGLLADLEGDDRYESLRFCQGSAALGLGLLCDLRGDDTYFSSLYSQGMGYVGGAGVLMDMAGDDRFVSGIGVRDAREQENAFQTYAQGFGLGCRPFASGGAGVLYDAGGRDRYEGSYFCQGASYWQSLGILIDGSGDDSFSARRYAQGAGIHFSAGALIDRRGDDQYESWGVSQGCGHDFSAGVLYDAGGDDLYAAEWLSQGAGSSRGVGLLLDQGGDDRYAGGNHETLQGSGTYDDRRDADSLGVLIDRAGDDDYSAGPARNTVWRRGRVGGGIDDRGRRPAFRPVSESAPTAGGRGGPFREGLQPEAPAGQSPVLAELEGPLFTAEAWKGAAAALAARGPEVIPMLCAYLKIRDVSVQQAVEESFKELGKQHLEEIHDYLLREAAGIDEKRFLLYVLADIGSPESAEIFGRFLGDDSPDMQAVSLRGFYKLGEPPPPERWETLSRSPSAAVRKYLCLALRASGRPEAPAVLAGRLADEDWGVRYAAFEAAGLKREQMRPILQSMRRQAGWPKATTRMIDALLK